MSSQLGDTGEDSVISGFVEEDSMFSFFFCLSLGPFLKIGEINTLAPPFFWLAAFAIDSFDFFVPWGAFAYIVTFLPLMIIIKLFLIN